MLSLIPEKEVVDTRKHSDIQGNSTVYGVSLVGIDVKDKRKILRNMVNPELGEYIFKYGTTAQITA